MHEFAQRLSAQSIRLTTPLATRCERDEQDETNDSNWRTDNRPTASDAKPLIDWDRRPDKTGNAADTSVNVKSTKHRKPKWVAGMVNGTHDR